MKAEKIYPVTGFSYLGQNIGLKENKKDFAMITCAEGATWAGVFTRNQIKAAPVKYDLLLREKVGQVKALVVNSGNANACTGEQGYQDVLTTTKAVSKALGCQPEEVLVASTGVIGEMLNLPLITNAIEASPKHLSPNNFDQAAESILTTDTVRKTASLQVDYGTKQVAWSAFAKGSGMIHPNMGTMLGFIMTDLNIDQVLLQAMLSQATEQSFNRISVDGDTSTNDSVFVLASGQAGNNKITDKNHPDYEQAYQELLTISQSLAQQIAADGEGATKFVDVYVKNAHSEEDAIKLAKSVATSNLVKTAMYGRDANWGRVVCALGYSEAEGIDEGKISISFSSDKGQVETFHKGTPVKFDEDLAVQVLGENEIVIDIDMGVGQDQAHVWTCDFTNDYIKINAEYRS